MQPNPSSRARGFGLPLCPQSAAGLKPLSSQQSRLLSFHTALSMQGRQCSQDAALERQAPACHCTGSTGMQAQCPPLLSGPFPACFGALQELLACYGALTQHAPGQLRSNHRDHISRHAQPRASSSAAGSGLIPTSSSNSTARPSVDGTVGTRSIFPTSTGSLADGTFRAEGCFDWVINRSDLVRCGCPEHRKASGSACCVSGGDTGASPALVCCGSQTLLVAAELQR